MKFQSKPIVFLYFVVAGLLAVNVDASSIINGKDSIDSEFAPNDDWTINQNIAFHTFPENFPYNGINSILKDHIGYMWFGTSEGLVRFDGINQTLYEHKPNEINCINHNVVNVIVEDKQGLIWVGTSKGLNLYNRELDNFIDIGSTDSGLVSLRYNYISDIYIDDTNRIWISTFGDGLKAYNYNEKTIKHYPFKNHNAKNINSLIKFDNKIWLGTLHGLYWMNKEVSGTKPEDVQLKIFENLSKEDITTLFIDTKGDLLIATRNSGLYRLKKEKNNYSAIPFDEINTPNHPKNNVILSLCEDLKGNIWVGTENNGLYLISNDAKYFKTFKTEEGNEQSINSNSIWSLFCDSENRIWIGTAISGINIIDSKFDKFESYKRNFSQPEHSLTHNNVKAFAEDNTGGIWIGTDGGGICYFNTKTKRIEKQLYNTNKFKKIENNAVNTVLIDNNKNLWVGMWAGGIDRFDISGKHIKNYSLIHSNGDEIKNLNTLKTDSKNNIWACTSGGGLFLYNKKTDEFEYIINEELSVSSNSYSYVTNIVEYNNRYLLSTLNGLYWAAFENKKITFIEEIKLKIGSDFSTRLMVNSIIIDLKNRVCLSTINNGIYIIDFDKNIHENFLKKDGLISNTTRGMLEDKNGNLWITTNRGITKFNYDSLSFTNYTQEDGLNSNEFNPNSCFRASDGKLYFGNEKGFNTFYPQQITKNELEPTIQLTNLILDNIPATIGDENSPLTKHISLTNNITLKHNQTSFSIEFVALNYTRPRRNKFKYKLEGFDEKWIDAGNNRIASYTNLESGKYTFYVMGSNNDGVWTTVPRKLNIQILPPLWKAWWAYIIYISLILVFGLVAFKIWQGRIKIKNQLLKEKLAKEAEHEMNEKNIEFFTNVSHEFRTPLSLIIGPLDSLIKNSSSALKDQLYIIQRNANRLLLLTNSLLHFRKFEEGGIMLSVQEGDILASVSDIVNYFKIRIKRRKLKLILESEQNELLAWFDTEKVETIMLNLLSNAIKYSPDGETIHIKVNSFYERDNDIDNATLKHKEKINASTRYVSIKVIDHGCGIPEEELPFIFDKFYQVKSTNKNKMGTGIGLALTKSLVEIHHGKIEAKSYPGIKTEFTVTLPTDKESYAKAEIMPKSSQIDDSKLVAGIFKNEGFDDAGLQNESSERAEILIVEDNDDLRNFLAKELGAIYNIKQAEDGDLGVELAQFTVPDLIISDVIMNQMSGFELCSSIKTDIRTSHIPVILLTAKSTIPDQIEGAEAGADAYITKPFNINLLVATINQLIQSRKNLYKLFNQDISIAYKSLPGNKIDQSFIEKTITFVQENITNIDLNVENLAFEMNLSRSNVYRKIKALTGKSAVEFIRDIRLKEALNLMECSNCSIAEIAYQTGFTSPSYFTKMFKRKYGKPPSDYLIRK
ncbi:MAG: response regulator [Bacteroidales bacterium]|nr:response regulator [Bacteroidales bacterium]MBN2818853.1 response regulator [Bacteroidales bacterium]